MDAYVEFFSYCGRHCLRDTGCRQCGGDAGGFSALAKHNDENPLDRCSPGERVLVCDSALHHGLQHESETCRGGNIWSFAYRMAAAKAYAERAPRES